MSIHRRILMYGAMAALWSVSSARVDAGVTVQFNNGTTNNTTALTGFMTTGADMSGMRVTATFSNGSTSSATWGTTGAASGAAVGTGFSLSESGDTFGSNWTLTNTSNVNLTNLFIDAGPGNTVYDTDFGGAAGTPGSANGNTFVQTGGSTALNILATYSDLVALNGSAPVGDLFRTLNLQFLSSGASFLPGASITYVTDTDNLRFAGDLTAVPEPSTVVSAGMGVLMALGYLAAKRRQGRAAA